jgi:hypothetical protein
MRSHRLEAQIVELAECQHGVVALGQLLELGLSARAVRGRVSAGRLHRIHRGVYALGRPSLTAHGRWMGAALACGPGAALSHRSAAALVGLRPSASVRIEVTVPRPASRGHSIRGIVVCDLCERLDDDAVAKAITRAEQLRLFDQQAIDELLERNHGARGTARLRRVTNELDPRTEHTRQELERRFLLLCRNSGLPAPARQRADRARRR